MIALIWRRLLKVDELHLAIASGIMLSLGGNYLSSDESGFLLLGKAIGWLASGSGMIVLGEMLKESREHDLRMQRKEIMERAEGNQTSLAIGQLVVLEPRVNEMVRRVETLMKGSLNDATQRWFAVLCAVVLPLILATFLLIEKALPEIPNKTDPATTVTGGGTEVSGQIAPAPKK